MKKLFLALAICQVLISCEKKNDAPKDALNDEPYIHFPQATVSIPPYVAGSADFVVESNIDWQISVTSGADWLQVNKSSGHGKDTIHVSVINENAGSQVRTATIMATVTNPALNLQAQLTVEQKPYNVKILSVNTIWGNSYEYITSITPAWDGGYLLTGAAPAGSYKDAWLVKLDHHGDAVWTRTIGGENDDKAIDAIATIDGGFIIAGNTYSSNSGYVGANHGSLDWWIVKLKSNGDTAWTRLIGTESYEEARTMAATADGGFVVAGYGNDPANFYNRDLLIAKFNSSGNVVWQKKLGGSDYEAANAVSVAIDGSIFIAASTASNNSGDVGTNHGLQDYWVIKLTSNGEKIWSKVLGGNKDDAATSIKSTLDGGCIVAGSTPSSENGDVTGKNHGYDDIWVLKLNARGDITWNNLLGGSKLDGIKPNTGIALTPDGGYVIAGEAWSTDGDVGGNDGSCESWVFKFNKNGQRLWNKTIGGPGYDLTSDLVMNIDGSFWIASNTYPPQPPPYTNAWIAKFKDY